MAPRIFWITQFLFVALILWSGLLLYRQAISIDGSFQFNFLWIFSAVIVKIIAVWIAALKFRELAWLSGLKMSFQEWFGLSVIPVFHSYLSPAQTGHVLRAVYLRRKHDFQYHRYTLMVLAITFLETAIAAAIGLLLTSVFFANQIPLKFFFIAVLAALIIMPVISLFILRLELLQSKTGFSKIADRMVSSLDLVISRPQEFICLIILSSGSVIARWLGLYCSFRACGFDIESVSVLIMECVRSVVGIVNITPSNIGIAEGVIVGTGALFGIPGSESLPAAVLSRLIAMVLYIVLGVWFTRKIFGKIFSLDSKSEDTAAF